MVVVRMWRWSVLLGECDGLTSNVEGLLANFHHSEYPKSWFHTIELAVGLETDTSEILNECIESVKNFGRVGVTGVYVGYTNHFNIGKPYFPTFHAETTKLTHPPRLPHGAWHPPNRQRPSTRPHVLA